MRGLPILRRRLDLSAITVVDATSSGGEQQDLSEPFPASGFSQHLSTTRLSADRIGGEGNYAPAPPQVRDQSQGTGKLSRPCRCRAVHSALDLKRAVLAENAVPDGHVSQVRSPIPRGVRPASHVRFAESITRRIRSLYPSSAMEFSVVGDMMARGDRFKSDAGYIDAGLSPPVRRNTLATHGRTIHCADSRLGPPRRGPEKPTRKSLLHPCHFARRRGAWIGPRVLREP